MINRLSDYNSYVDSGDIEKLEASAFKGGDVADREVLVVSGEGWEQNWTYVEEFGSFYRVNGKNLMYVPAMKNGLPVMVGEKANEGRVEFENIETEDAAELRRIFGQDLE